MYRCPIMCENRLFVIVFILFEPCHEVAAKLISVFVFATRIIQSLYFLNFKHLAIFFDCTARFVLDLVGNPEDRFFTTKLIFTYFGERQSDIACVRDSPNDTIGNFTNGTVGNQRTLNVSRPPKEPLMPMLPLVETLVPMVPLVSPMVSTVI